MNHNILDPHHADVFVEFFGLTQKAVHHIAKSKGWWSSEDAESLRLLANKTVAQEDGMEIGLSNDDRRMLFELAQKLEDRNTGEIIALMHSELSEGLEGERHGNPPSDHIPEFSAMEEELSDVIIRAMDLAEKRGYRLAEAIVEKIKFNNGRSHKHGGKRF